MIGYFLPKKGFSMLKIDIVISKNNIYKHNTLAYYYKNSNILRLVFKSEKEYLDFLENPILTRKDFNSQNLKLIPKEIDTIILYSRLTELIKSSTPLFEIDSYYDLPIQTLLTKRKIYLNIIKLSFKETIEILRNSYIHENVLFFDKYNEGQEMSLKDLIEMYEKLLSIINEISDKNYSPVESLFYAYNIVKSRIFKREKKYEDSNISRCLSEILKQEKIVCSGFANFLLSLCDILNIPAERIWWMSKNDKKAGHDTIAVYLNDNKYDIHGIFAIDPTWDSKQNLKDTNYKTYIKHFLTPMNIEEKEKAKENLIPKLDCSYYRFFILYDLYKYDPTNTFYKEQAFKNAQNIFSYLQISFIENLDYIYQKLKEFGEQLLDNNTIRRIVTTVTPLSEKDLKKILSTTPHQLNKKESNQILRRTLINLKR